MEKKTVDCVIVGTGMGGTTAAALLAHYGYKVLVLEKRARVGGRFSTQVIDGFKCPTGALMILRSTELEKTFKLTGAKFEVSNCSEVHWMINNEIYSIIGSFIGRVKTNIAAFKNFRYRHYKFLFWIFMNTLKALFFLIIRKLINLFRSKENQLEKKSTRDTISFRDWMDKITDDETIKSASHALVSSLFTATNDFECPAEDVFEWLASMANIMKPKKFGYATRGNIELIKSLLKVVTDKGSEVITEAEVNEIKVENGKVTGVIVSTKEGDIDVDAKVVISNAGARATMEMGGEKNFPADYVNDVKERLRPIPIIMGLIASDVPLLDKSGLTVIQGTNAIVTGVTLTLHTNEIAPGGQHLLWTCGTPKQCLNKMDPEEEIRRNEEDMEKAFPLYKKHGRVLKWEIKDVDNDLPCMRTWPGWGMPIITPMPNLYNVGDSVMDPGWCGSPACARSAWKVVDIIRKQMKP